MIYPHQTWANTCRRSPGVWFTLIHAEASQNGAMRVMAHRIRQGTFAEWRPRGAFDAIYRDRVLWAQFRQPVGLP